MLARVAANDVDVQQLLRGRERSLVHRPRRRLAPVVHLDNEHSHRYTVVEIIADDAPGLLYRVSRAISDHGCDVDLVLISTEGQKAIDVLHVTKHGHKLSETDQAALTRELETTLEASYEAH
jgi:[protein-PII] uridylyltransferase